MSEPITNDTYADEMSQVILAVHMLDACRVDELLAIVEKSEALGPILQPTAYRDGGHRRLREQQRILTACAEVLRVWRQINAESTVASRPDRSAD